MEPTNVNLMTVLGIARLVAAKDLRIEVRSRVLTNQVAPFALIVMIMFAFALDNEAILPRVAPGLVWLAALFSVLIVVSRSFAVESSDGALDQLRSSGVSMVGVYLGKTVALMVQMLLLVALLVASALVLYRTDLTLAGGVLLVTTGITATCGLATIGTLYGGLAAGTRGRETLLPLLLLPVAAPVLIGATRATEAAFGTDGLSASEGWPWLGLLVVFAVLFAVAGALAFGPLLDE